MSFSLLDIIQAEEIIQSDKGSSYIQAYPEFINYFKYLESIEIHNFIIGTHFVYGWMPTILDLRGSNKTQYASVVELLNKVKIDILLKEEEISNIARVVNNSLVGTSKLLHFINPNCYAIWDSRVYWFWGKNTPYNHRMQDIKAFMSYLNNCKVVINTNGFERVHKSVNEKIGYEVSAMRAVEWVAYKTSENKVY